MELQGRTVMVTGASRGIGAALGAELAGRGANVALLARTGEGVEAVAERIRATGGQALALRADVTREEDVVKAVRRTIMAFGEIGGVVNNAGVLGARVPFDSYPVDDLRACLDVHAVGSFLVTRAALPHLRSAKDAFVVNVSSYLGRHGLPDAAGYIAGKFALEGLTQALAAEVNGHSLAVVSVGPGMVATRMLASYLGEEELEGYRSPTEAAAALADLCEQLTLAENGAALDLFPAA